MIKGSAIVSGKGWVVIPKQIREKHGLTKGKKVYFIDWGEGIIHVMPAHDDPIGGLAGRFEGGPSLVQALLKDRRQELEWEERDLPPPPGKEREWEEAGLWPKPGTTG